MRKVFSAFVSAAFVAAFLAGPALAAGERAAEIAACNTYAAVKAQEGGVAASPPTIERGPTAAPPAATGPAARPDAGTLTPAPPAVGGLQAAGTELERGMSPAGQTDQRYAQAYRECVQKFQP